MNVCDTLNARLKTQGAEDGISVPTIPPGGTASVHLRLSIASPSVSQKIRGSLTYFVQEGENSSSEKLDFKLAIPTTTFLSPATIGKEAYGILLSGDEIDMTASASCSSPLTFKKTVQRITQRARFSVVEEVASAASLYATTQTGEPIAILVKKTTDGLQIDGKAADQQLISSLVDDLRELCSRK
ncbi:unnamed protein product, partial [Mesorhabditis spiculigera]